MEKPIDHNAVSGTATVAGSTAKGALGGFVTAGLLGAAAFAAVAAVPALAIYALGAAGATVVAGTAIVAAAGFVAGAAGLGGIGAAIGSGVGVVKGASKVRGEQREFNELAQNPKQNVDSPMLQAQQQAYMAGAREGKMQLIQQIQESQAQQQASFAEKHAKKGAITPEQIIEQRKLAAASSQQLGA